MTRLLIGLKHGLFGYDSETGGAPVSLFPGIQPLSVAVDPGQPARLYCATYDRGLWRSEDFGRTWVPVGTPQDYFGPPAPGSIEPRATTYVSVCSIPEADGRHAVWVGTEPSRLYCSTDHGQTFTCVSPLELPSRAQWSFPPRPATHHVQRIAQGANGWLHVAIEAGAMLRSCDGGRTFHDRLPDSPIDAHVLLTHPKAPGRLYAALGDALFTAGRSFAESFDDGDSWSYSGQGLESMPYLYGLAINPEDPDDIRVAASRNPQAAHAGGGSSIWRREAQRWVEDGDGFAREQSLVPVLAADPADQGSWFALSDQGLFAKKRGATAWARLAAPDDWRGMHPTTLTVLQHQTKGQLKQP
ncbi:sialidase family protein [Pseudomonas sp. RIT-PI-S]|uniref:WD40/YVTN/BNR-like repeat-containing protein n=1 Tax=Pseudomonas sp. RIT-PI-S TaxID=3035295 RepID=UPI0021D9EC53|nr:sialidase family protein [Pseudomonas sp. RIT-PI-S]